MSIQRFIVMLSESARRQQNRLCGDRRLGVFPVEKRPYLGKNRLFTFQANLTVNRISR